MEQNIGGTPDQSRQPAHSEAQEPANVQQDTSAAAPVDAAPGSAVPEPATPATPANEEADAASGQPQQDTSDNDDQVVEADAREPGPVSPDSDLGDDSEVNEPERSAESYEADPEDQHGASDHPES